MCPRKYIKDIQQTYVCGIEKEHFAMVDIFQGRKVDPMAIEKKESALQVQYYIWDGCIEAKWIEIEGVYLVNPKFIKLFKERHKQN